MLVGHSLVQLILDVVKDLVDSLPGRVGKGRLSQRTPQVGDRLQRADLELALSCPIVWSPATLLIVPPCWLPMLNTLPLLIALPPLPAAASATRSRCT